MNTLYVLQNQHGYFLQKTTAEKGSKSTYTWGDGVELSKIFRTPFKDEAINMMFESGAQDVELRITIRSYSANTKGLPIIPTDDMPAPLPATNILDPTLTDTDYMDRETPASDDTHITSVA